MTFMAIIRKYCKCHYAGILQTHWDQNVNIITLTYATREELANFFLYMPDFKMNMANAVFP